MAQEDSDVCDEFYPHQESLMFKEKFQSAADHDLIPALLLRLDIEQIAGRHKLSNSKILANYE